ncbi:MAG: hypothetical protein KAQ81_00390 [Deltaproteobacteria bacterium]|nr:hypothetical protein [Deltaproteobacteria bacterium]
MRETIPETGSSEIKIHRMTKDTSRKYFQHVIVIIISDKIREKEKINIGSYIEGI